MVQALARLLWGLYLRICRLLVISWMVDWLLMDAFTLTGSFYVGHAWWSTLQGPCQQVLHLRGRRWSILLETIDNLEYSSPQHIALYHDGTLLPKNCLWYSAEGRQCAACAHSYSANTVSGESHLWISQRYRSPQSCRAGAAHFSDYHGATKVELLNKWDDFLCSYL